MEKNCLMRISVKYYYDDQIMNEMGGVYSTHREARNVYELLGGKHRGKRSLG
jgi:hypothetical protein